MLQSKLFTKTLREAPSDEQSQSAKLLLRAGFVDKVAAGLYTMLPLGFLVLQKIERIIVEEMDKLGAQRVLMTGLVPKKNWDATGRWQVLDDLFKLESRNKDAYGLGVTHEEVITPIAKKFVFSYKDLPFSAYQIQTKFRDELRAKSGLLRTREFLMKDLYSFHSDQKDLDEFYQKVKKAYFKIFNRAGLRGKTYFTCASGGTFSEFSHEFQALTPAGEDIIFICAKCGLAINREIKDKYPQCPECGAGDFKEEKSIEVGNIFQLGTKFSDAFSLEYSAKTGQKKAVIMACYGIGLQRLMGAVVEANNDGSGIVWPKAVAPFDIHLLELPSKNASFEKRIRATVKKIYADLQKQGIEVLYDDRSDKSVGEKFKDCDLIGIPVRIVVSERTLEKKSVEIKNRNSKAAKLVKISELAKLEF